MYSQNLVVCLKVGGKILQENRDSVFLPFGSEYSLLIKNLNSVRMQVAVSVDGQDATEGNRLVIGPNAHMELERFIKGGNLNAGNRFKFIERTAVVEQHRGIGAEDGLIRVEGWRERVAAQIPWSWPSNPRIGTSGPLRSSMSTPRGPGGSSVPSANMGARSGQATAKGANTKFRSFDSMEQSKVEVERSGITVPGTESRQQFHSVSGFPLEHPSTVIVLRLRGQVEGEVVAEPITVSHKPECVTCGRQNRASHQFCSQCGTALAIL